MYFLFLPILLIYIYIYIYNLYRQYRGYFFIIFGVLQEIVVKGKILLSSFWADFP